MLHVRPADRGRVPTWLGQPGVLSPTLCQAMMQVLLHQDDDEARWLTQEAALEIQALREGYEGLLEEGSAPLESLPEGVQWHTFAGGAINRLLAAGLEKETGHKWVSGNLSLRCKDLDLVPAGQAIAQLPKLPWEQVAADAAHHMARGPISKFQPCLPKAAETHLLAERLLDLPGTIRFLTTVKVNGQRTAQRPTAASGVVLGNR